MTERTCGACSLCCKLAYIPELNKSIDSWCRYARPGVSKAGGCTIHPDRPTSCRDFECAWLVGAHQFGDEWFPAHCKMIITRREPRRNLAEQGILVTVDPTYPNAWRRKPYYVQLLKWAQQMVVEIRVGLRCIRLDADGSELQQVQTRAWLEGREEPKASCEK
jgi:hypothetical protein